MAAARAAEVVTARPKGMQQQVGGMVSLSQKVNSWVTRTPKKKKVTRKLGGVL